MPYTLATVVLLLLSISEAPTVVKPYPRTIESKIYSVIDGNTFVITEGNDKLTIQLEYADSPESGQYGHDDARNFLEKKIGNRKVTVVITGKDRYGNLVATVKLKSTNIGLLLIQEGLAWAKPNSPPEMQKKQAEAKNAELGIWKNASTEPPWIYRRKKTMRSPKGS